MNNQLLQTHVCGGTDAVEPPAHDVVAYSAQKRSPILGHRGRLKTIDPIPRQTLRGLRDSIRMKAFGKRVREVWSDHDLPEAAFTLRRNPLPRTAGICNMVECAFGGVEQHADEA